MKQDILEKNGVSTKLNENWKKAIYRYYDKCLEDGNVYGLILRGSVAHNMSSRYSDLDLRVIHKGSMDEKEDAVFEDGIPIHLISYSIDYVKKQITSDNLLLIDMMLNDVILLDKQGELEQMRTSLRKYTITEKVYFEYLDSAKSSMINAIDLFQRNEYAAACINLRDASLKLGFLFLLSNGKFRPKQQWIVQQLKECAPNEFLTNFFAAQEIGMYDRERIICQLKHVSNLIYYFEKEGLYATERKNVIFDT